MEFVSFVDIVESGFPSLDMTKMFGEGIVDGDVIGEFFNEFVVERNCIQVL